jgi:hypothetical protein
VAPAYDPNSPIARAQRVKDSGVVRGSTPLSQQVTDVVNFGRRQAGLPERPVTGLAPTMGDGLGGGSPAPNPPEVLPMWLADP